MIGRSAATVAPSIGPCASTSTRRSASSGSRSSTGSSRRSLPSSNRSRAATATTGFVIEAMRKMAVAAHRRGLAAGQRAGDADLEVAVAPGEPGEATDVAARGVALQDRPHPGDAGRVESAHQGFDRTTVRNSSPTWTR